MTRSPVFLGSLLFAVSAPLPSATAAQLLQAFEGDGFQDWQAEGPAFGLAPVPGVVDGLNGELTGYAQAALACSAHGGDAATGTLTSPEITISEPFITFLIAGGDYPGKTAVQLLIDGEVVREAVGQRDLQCRRATWDVKEFEGRKARIRLIDDEQGAWGFIAADHIVMTASPEQEFPAMIRRDPSGGLVKAEGESGMTIPEGSKVTVLAGREQQVISPTAIALDEQGNLFVAETHRFRAGVEDNRDNLHWYHDDMAAQTTADRLALHDKWREKLPMEALKAKSEIVRRLSAPDENGVYGQSAVFADGFNDPLDGTAAGIFAHEGTIYFACIPKLWMLRDSTGDGVADVREVIEDGFGVRVSLSGHDMNGFAFGPDGRIYGTIGDRGFSVTTKDGREFHYPNEGAVFRFEPDGSGFEVFHTGLRNPKEIAFDAWGDAFTVDNDSDQGDRARIVYIVEGGDSGWQMEHQGMHTFHRQIGLEERPPSRWMNQRMWELENDAQPAYMLPPSALLTSGPSGLTVHPGTGFLQSEDGRFLICDYRGGASNSGIWSFAMARDGAGMKMEDARHFNWGVAATDVEYSWDGRVIVADFIGGWKSHDDGRIYAVDPGQNMWRAEEAASAAKLVAEGFDHRESGELADLLKHLDARIRLRAQFALSRKGDALERFTAASASAHEMERLHGIWGLGVLARRGAGVAQATNDGFATLPEERLKSSAAEALMGLFEHEDAEVRAQALRAIADSGVPGDSLPLAPLLIDESPRVRYFAAIAAGKLKALGLYGPICQFIAENDNRDRHLRHAGIFALQHLTSDSSQLTALESHESAAVRLAAVVALRRNADQGLVTFIHDADPAVADEAVRAVTDLSLDEVRPFLARLLDDPEGRAWSPFALRRLIHNAFRVGRAEDAARVLKVAADARHPEEVRKEAFRLLEEWTEPYPIDQLTGHWRPLEKRDPSVVRGVLAGALPELLGGDGFVLTSALRLVDRHDVAIDALDDDALRGLAANAELPAGARAKAVELLIERSPADLETALRTLAADPAAEVALAALAGLAGLAPATAMPALEALLASDDPALARRAWPIVASMPGESAAAVVIAGLAALAEAGGVSPVALELMAAAAARPEPTVAAALDEFNRSLESGDDPLGKWLPALEGGDAAAGAMLFESHPTGQCMRCHRADEGHSAGGEAGPSLAGIAKRHDRRYFLESMVKPGAVVAPGFGIVVIEFHNGASLGGNLLAETGDHLDLDAAGRIVRVMKTDVASITPPVSAMPSTDGLLSLEETRDLVAWLATLDQGEAIPALVTEPEILDPATLLVTTESEPGAESPAAEDATDPAPSDASSAIDPELMKTGQQQYLMCGACHGHGGEGGGAGPPLAGSEWVTGPVENLIRIQLRGLTGPITVKGQVYDFPAGMMAMAYQNDDQIAAVLTYIRNSFGNEASVVTAAEVAALRHEVGMPPMTEADLIPPLAGAPAAVRQVSTKYDQVASGSGISGWIVLLIAGFIGICFAPLVVRKFR